VSTTLPGVGEVLAPILERIPLERRPLFIALAERLAAARYREWATAWSDARRKDDLLACADREEDIARRVEGLTPNASAVQQEIVAANPDLEEINRSLFAGRSLPEQFTIQAAGERLGAATWRAFAKHATAPEARDVYLRCAELEEASAVVLESLLSGGDR
jgi:hypothetical protein